LINGRSVNLKKLESDYLPHIYKWRNDPELMRFYGLYPILSLDKVQEEIKTNKNLKNRLDFIVLSKNRDPIGMVWLRRIDWINSNCELNCMIGEKNFRSKVFGAEAIFLLLLFCMNELNLHKVHAKIIEFAHESHALVSNAGFKKEAVLKKMVFQDGKYRDLIVYGLLRKEFEAFTRSTQGQKYLLFSRQI
jgi:RimJ/RimL family protein N-acetyltransferase